MKSGMMSGIDACHCLWVWVEVEGPCELYNIRFPPDLTFCVILVGCNGVC